MRPRLLVGLLLLVALGPAFGRSGAAYGQAGDAGLDERTMQLVAPVRAAGRERDSLSALADKAKGRDREQLEEQLWRRQLEVHSGLMAVTRELEKWQQQGLDLTPARAVLAEILKSGWPRYRDQFARRETSTRELLDRRNAAKGAARLEIESQLTAHSDRTARMFRNLVEAMLALERLGVDVRSSREFLVATISAATERTHARIVVLRRERALASDRLKRTPNDAEVRVDLESIEESFNRAIANVDTEIDLLQRLGEDVTAHKVALVVATGRLNASAFEPRVLGGLLAHAQHVVVHTLSARLPVWLFQALLVSAFLVGFSLLSKVVRRLVRRGVQRANVSQLLRDTVTSWSGNLVMMIAVVVVLRQLGVELGPMLAGLGIAGFVLGFALQDTLSNFAAGAMILAYRPFDIGDIVEAAGVVGTVKTMSLVSTTILTFDNQTMIVPNKKMWGDVIRITTAQATRRVDLTFSVGYDEDVEHVERVLQEIVTANAKVLREPESLIKLHRLGESSVDFVVRVWALKDHYWDVYWDLTRAVKIRFDQEKITIPYPQREVHVRSTTAGPADGV